MLLLVLSSLTVTPAVYVEVRATTTSTVVISDLAFNPKNVTVKVGSTITWVNKDALIYTLWFVKADDGTKYLSTQLFEKNEQCKADYSYKFGYNLILRN
jgi:plastocyanin